MKEYTEMRDDEHNNNVSRVEDASPARITHKPIDSDDVFEVEENGERPQKCKKHIATIEEAPAWLIDNHFIIRGYRIGYYSVSDVLKSLFMCHNETTNIWSHLSGVLLFLGLITYIIFFVGGLSITRPLDALIDRFDSKYEHHNGEIYNAQRDQVNMSASIGDVCLKLWQDTVVLQNPMYFDLDENSNSGEKKDTSENLAANMGMTAGRQHLYETTLQYILSVIQKFVYSNHGPDNTREDLYVEFSRLEDPLMQSVDSAIKANEEKLATFNVISLTNLKRNLKFHFSSANVKELIVTGTDEDEEEVSMHELTRVPLYIHMVSAVICLSLSSTFHLFSCCNEEANNYLSRLDYGGISFLIAGSCMPPYFYSFYCEDTIVFAYAYSVMIFTICFAAFVVTLLPKFDQPKFRPLRATLYILAGLSTALPCFHVLLDRHLYVYPFDGFLWMLGGAIYIGGAIIYGLRFPERFFPKRFDYFGSSHNIFHFCVLIAASAHFFGSMGVYHGRRVLIC